MQVEATATTSPEPDGAPQERTMESDTFIECASGCGRLWPDSGHGLSPAISATGKALACSGCGSLVVVHGKRAEAEAEWLLSFPKTCGKCASTIPKAGACPVCEDSPWEKGAGLQVGQRFGTAMQIELTEVATWLNARVVETTRHWTALGYREGVLLRLVPVEHVPKMWRVNGPSGLPWFLLDETDGTFEHHR